MISFAFTSLWILRRPSQNSSMVTASSPSSSNSQSSLSSDCSISSALNAVWTAGRSMESSNSWNDSVPVPSVSISLNMTRNFSISSSFIFSFSRSASSSCTMEKEKLKEQISTLNMEIAEIDSGMKEATDLRTKEKTEFDASSAEYKQSADAVANAIQVLQSYYSQGSFVQARAAQAPELGGAKSDIGSTIISMLEVAESEFTQLLSEATAAENAAASSFEKLGKKNTFARAAKIEEVKGKGSELKSLEMNLLNYKEDRETTGKELDAVLAYLDKLKPQCETKVVSFDERKAKREADIAGLKEALAILSS